MASRPAKMGRGSKDGRLLGESEDGAGSGRCVPWDMRGEPWGSHDASKGEAEPVPVRMCPSDGRHARQREEC
eukprot:15960642-Heterocapsa_arctica.AAC.1